MNSDKLSYEIITKKSSAAGVIYQWLEYIVLYAKAKSSAEPRNPTETRTSLNFSQSLEKPRAKTA